MSGIPGRRPKLPRQRRHAVSSGLTRHTHGTRPAVESDLPARRIQLLPNFNNLLQTRKPNGLSLQSCRRETPKPRTDGPRPPLGRTLEFSHGELGARLVHPAPRRVRACPHCHGPPRACPLVVVYRRRVSIRERRTCQDGWGPPDTGQGLFGHVDLTRSPGRDVPTSSGPVAAGALLESRQATSTSARPSARSL